MITINLLPIGAFKEQYKGRMFLSAYGLFVFILLIAMVSIKSNVFDTTLQELDQSDKSYKSQALELKSKVGKANLETAKTYRQWKQLAAIIELEERRRDQTRLLVEIESLVPKNSAWLLNLNHIKGVLTLEGISTDKEIVSQFLSRLENATYITKQSVIPLEIAQNMVINNIKLTKFKITAQTNFPSPTILDNGLSEYGLPPQKDFLALVKEAAPSLVPDLKAGDKGKRL